MSKAFATYYDEDLVLQIAFDDTFLRIMSIPAKETAAYASLWRDFRRQRNWPHPPFHFSKDF